MGDVLNLNKARKAAARRQDEVRAAENRVLHGLSKAERKLRAARSTKARSDLDAHGIERGDER